MVFTGPVLYLAFTSSEIVKIFLDNLIVLVCLDNNPKIYFDYFVEVARKNDKIYNRGTCFVLFYLPYLSSIHEKANCIAILWTGRPHSLGSCLFRGLWATCLPHKGGASR